MFHNVFIQHEKLHIYAQDLNGKMMSVNQSVIKSFGLESGLFYIGKTHMEIPGQEHYLEAVKLKLNCQTRPELILQAIERGLVIFL